MKRFFARLFGRAEPVLAPAHPRDAAVLSAIHTASFNRGWSEQEFEQLLTDRNVVADRAASVRKPVGFIMSRRAADEAEILSVAVARSWQGRGLARKLYARAGFSEVGRRPGYYAQGRGKAAAALVLRRDLV